jgi:hypothetical protein
MNTAYEQKIKNANRSNRYQHVTTSELGDVLINHGFQLTGVKSGRVKQASDSGYEKHIARFSKLKALYGNRPELIIKNNHLGTGSLQILMGLYRLVCANGLVVGSSYGLKKYNHTGDILQNINRDIPAILTNFDSLVENIRSWSRVKPTNQQVKDLSWRAAEIMLENSKNTLVDVDASQFTRVARFGDVSDNSWVMFNRIQESVFRRRVQAMVADESGARQIATLRRVGESTARAVEINQKLWSAAVDTFKLVDAV